MTLAHNPVFVRCAAILVCFGGLACSETAPPPTAPAPGIPPAADPGNGSRPNIVLVVIDTLRADHLSTYGYDRATSPNLDRLAARGTVFSRAYAQSGWTLASMATLMTGLYPHQHRVARDGCQPDAYGKLDADRRTLAEGLVERGYRAGAWVNNTFMAPVFGLGQGFTPYDYSGATNDTHRSAMDTVAAGLTWLDTPKTPSQPSFLVLHFMEPHLDYSPPAAQRGTFAKGPPAGRLATLPFGAFQTGQATPTDDEKAYMMALYDEEVLAADAALGALMDGLESRGALDNTIVVVTADHGEEFWDHGGFEHGHALWSALTRVPLVIAGPDLPQGKHSNVLVEHVDLVRGLANQAGAQLDPEAVGVDIFEVATGPDVGRAAMSDNCLYGPSCVSITDGRVRFLLRHHLSMDPAAPTDLSKARVRPVAEVWAMSPDGMETTILPKPEAEKLAPGLARMLEARRGTLAPLMARDGAAVPDHATFQMLRELGYVDRPDAASQPQTPCR